MADAPLILLRAGAVRDAMHVNARPGAVALREGAIVAAGEPAEVRKIAGKPDRVIDLPDALILPVMVNAHAHLDLTDLGPRPYGGDFIQWVEMVMQSRPRDDAATIKAVQYGQLLSRDAGVGWIGDIAGSAAAIRARIEAGPQWTRGRSWLECFGHGEQGRTAATQAIALAAPLNAAQQQPESQRISIDLQPHAPYSAGALLYEAAGRALLGFPSTHLAETPAELEFIRDATGPFADLLRRIGKWDASIKPTGLTPVAHLQHQLAVSRWTLAHCNYVTDDDIAILKRTGATVAYCPIASDYFGHKNHRYREMIEAGIPVALGTDSIVCQPAGETQPMGILPQMRWLYQRDGTDPATLLRMATIGAPASDTFAPSTLAPGARSDLIVVRFEPEDATDPLTQVLRSSEPAIFASGGTGD